MSMSVLRKEWVEGRTASVDGLVGWATTSENLDFIVEPRVCRARPPQQSSLDSDNHFCSTCDCRA